MSYEFKFPDVGEGITEGEIVKWKVKEGDTVKEHDVLAEIETDKAVVEIPSPVSGKILKLNHKDGDTVKVGEVLAVIGNEGEKTPFSKESTPAISLEPKKGMSVVGYLEEAPDVEEKIVAAPSVHPSQESSKSDALAAPATRRLARDLGIDLSKITGTGIDGRITEEDVRKMAGWQKKDVESIPTVRVSKKYDLFGYIEHIPLQGIRKVIAKKMNEFAKVPAVTSMDEADVTELWELREKEKTSAEKAGIRLTFLPFIMKAVIAGLKEEPMLASELDEENEEIIVKKYFNFGFGVDTEDGLIVPVLKGVDMKGILDIAKELQALSLKARTRSLDIGDMKGSSFSITNIGSIGGLFFTPIMNNKESAILGIGKINEKPVVKEGHILVRKIMPLSLTFDHRVLDGATAARFMNAVIKHLESPRLLLVERN